MLLNYSVALLFCTALTGENNLSKIGITYKGTNFYIEVPEKKYPCTKSCVWVDSSYTPLWVCSLFFSTVLKISIHSLEEMIRNNDVLDYQFFKTNTHRISVTYTNVAFFSKLRSNLTTQFFYE